MHTEKQRQRRRDDARLTESGNASSEQLLVVSTESLTNRVWLEWIRTSKARLVFSYEISDLFVACIHSSISSPGSSPGNEASVNSDRYKIHKPRTKLCNHHKLSY